MRIDHVVLGSRDLDATSERFLRDYGLASVPGGSHAAWGTANRIVPLGDDYLEFLAVVDPVTANGSTFGSFVRDLTAEGDRWSTICLGDDDLDATATRLGLEVVRGSRQRPDGSEVRWRSAGLEDPRRAPWMPFFIEWLVPSEDLPGRMQARHDVDVDGIGWVEIAGDAARMQEWLGGADVPIRMVDDAPAGLRRVGVVSPSGEVVV